jgi:F-type H+-transporting ATPase subunit b
VATAEARTQEYEQKLREARATLFKAQDARRQRAQQMRNEAIAEARARAQEQIRQAKQALEQDMAAARAGLQADSDRLATDIIRTILKPAGAAPVAGGAQ